MGTGIFINTWTKPLGFMLSIHESANRVHIEPENPIVLDILWSTNIIGVRYILSTSIPPL